jgi:hypothetical protein
MAVSLAALDRSVPPYISPMPHDSHPAALASLGSIEPHAPLLRRPPAGQLLYKVMSVENCIRSIEAGYLHFNHVDSYKDFTGADQHDGEQLAADRHGNKVVTFAKAPDFSFADYCDRSRSRTYAFCASLENSDHVWTYSDSTPKGNVGVVFDFDKLRTAVNRTLQSAAASLEYNGVRCPRSVSALRVTIVAAYLPKLTQSKHHRQ